MLSDVSSRFAVVALLLVAVTSACNKSKSRSAYRSVMIAPHDAATGMRHVEDPSRVRRLVDSLGVDALSPVACPTTKYEEQRGTLMLFDDDGLARTNVYVLDDGHRIELLAASMGQCRRGPPADATALLAELARD
jgi:hypothetical protein